MSPRGWIRLARTASAVGLATFAVVTLATPLESGLGSFFNTWVYNGLMVLACVIAGSRAYVVQRERVAWVAFTVALGSWTFGEIWYAALQPESFPSLADVGLLGFYPLVYVGMVALVRSRTQSIGGTLWLDGLTASLAAGALAAAVLVEVVLHTTEGSLTTVATNLAYPIGDVLLLSAIVGVFALTGWRAGRRWLLLGVGVLSIALADGAYLFQTASETYVEGGWVDVLWPTGMLLIAAGAWASDRSGTQLEVEGRPLLAVPAFCALIAIGVLVYDHFDQVNLLAVVLATAALLAVVLRLATTFRENRRLFELTRNEAITDDLTGLGNRRKLIWDLERLLASEQQPTSLLMLFDLDGFKVYNDSFGHLAGDALLVRLGEKLADAGYDNCAAYRLGGDEFCVLAPVSAEDVEPLIDRACNALSERGEGFEISSSFGAVILPDEASSATEALHLADERLYAQKYSRRGESDRTMHAFLDTLSEREPDLPGHAEGVATLAVTSDARSASAATSSTSSTSCAAPRRRKARSPGRDPPQERAARRARMGIHPPAHTGRGADSASGTGLPQHRARGAIVARALGRNGVSGRPRGRGHPASVPDHLCLRRVRGDDVAASVPGGSDPRGGTRRDGARRGHAVRSDRRPRPLRPRSRPARGRARRVADDPTGPRAYCGRAP